MAGPQRAGGRARAGTWPRFFILKKPGSARTAPRRMSQPTAAGRTRVLLNRGIVWKRRCVGPERVAQVKILTCVEGPTRQTVSALVHRKRVRLVFAKVIRGSCTIMV